MWKEIPGYEGLYEVSVTGDVRSIRTGRLLKPMWCGAVGQKYASVALCRNSTQRVRRVHHLVLELFVGPRPPGGIACHKSDDKTDNSAENLYWGSYASNARDRVANNHHFGQQLTAGQVAEIRRRRAAGERGVDLAREFGVSQQVIWNVKSGRTGGWIK